MNFQTLLNNTTTKRDTLKPAFNVGEIPTQQHFYDMIDGLFLQDDTVYKDANNGLAIQAGTDANKTALLLYADATSEPAWQLGIANGFELKDTAGNTQLMVTNDGKVGVGTTSPGAKLHVHTKTNEMVIFTTDDLDQGIYEQFTIYPYYRDANNPVYGDKGTTLFEAPKKAEEKANIHFSWRGGGNGLFIKGDDGNVGIGTTSPQGPLEVKTGSVWNGTIRVNSNAENEYSSFALYGNDQLKWAIYQHHAAGIEDALLFANSSGQDKFILHQDGKMGINTLLPSHVLEINDTNHGGDLLSLTRGTGKARFLMDNNQNNLYIVTGDTVTNGLFIQSNGNVGIGTTSPTQLLSVNGNAGKSQGGSSWSIFSDERIKKNIRPFNDGLATLLHFEPKIYEYNGKGGHPDDGKEHIGIIAQEIASHAPYTLEKVPTKLNPEDEEDTDLWMYNDSAITYVLINAVKELNQQQQQTIEAQQAQIDNLVERMVALENLLAAAKS